VFDDLAEIADLSIQALLREISSETLLLALKGADDVVKDKFFKNMSKRASEMLRDDLQAKGPVRVTRSRPRSARVLSVARRMADEGQIVLARAARRWSRMKPTLWERRPRRDSTRRGVRFHRGFIRRGRRYAPWGTDMRTGKLICAADLGACEAWELPLWATRGPLRLPGAPRNWRDAHRGPARALHAQAYQEGFDQGRRAGDARGHQEGLVRASRRPGRWFARLEAILATLAAPLAELDAAIEESLVALAVSVARHLVRRELRTDPGQVIAVIREAVAVLR